MKNLNEMSKRYPLTDKGPMKADGSPGHNYTEIYQKNFEKLQNKSLNILEIGFGGGDSLKMWADFFEKSNIFCIDNNLSRIEEYGYTQHERIKIFFGDQSNGDSIVQAMKQIGVDKLDIIIDDGSHIREHIITTFNTLFDDYLSPGGIYFVEDFDNSINYESSNIKSLEYHNELTTIIKK